MARYAPIFILYSFGYILWAMIKFSLITIILEAMLKYDISAILYKFGLAFGPCMLNNFSLLSQIFVVFCLGMPWNYEQLYVPDATHMRRVYHMTVNLLPVTVVDYLWCHTWSSIIQSLCTGAAVINWSVFAKKIFTEIQIVQYNDFITEWMQVPKPHI